MHHLNKEEIMLEEYLLDKVDVWIENQIKLNRSSNEKLQKKPKSKKKAFDDKKTSDGIYDNFAKLSST